MCAYCVITMLLLTCHCVIVVWLLCGYDMIIVALLSYYCVIIMLLLCHWRATIMSLLCYYYIIIVAWMFAYHFVIMSSGKYPIHNIKWWNITWQIHILTNIYYIFVFLITVLPLCAYNMFILLLFSYCRVKLVILRA